MKKNVLFTVLVLISGVFYAQNNIEAALNSRISGNTSICATNTTAAGYGSVGVFPINSLYSNGSGSSLPMRNNYFTTPNSGAYYKENAANLTMQEGEDMYYNFTFPNESCPSTKSAWYFLDQPNTSAIGYRISTFNNVALTNVRTVIQIYEANANASSSNISNLFYDANNVPRYTKLATVQNGQGGVIDLRNPSNILNGGAPFISQNGNIVPKPLLYSRSVGGTRYLSDYTCSLLDTVQTDISTSISLNNSGTFGSYIELYNPEPNKRYYIQVLIYPSSSCQNEQFYTLALHSELLSSESYVQGNNGLTFNSPVYLFPDNEFLTNPNNLNSVIGLRHSSERSYIIDSNNLLVRLDPIPASNSGYSTLSITKSQVNLGNASLFFPNHETFNKLSNSNFGSSGAAGGYSPQPYVFSDINTISKIVTGTGIALDNTPGVNDDNNGYHFNYYYNFTSNAGIVRLATYASHTSHTTNDIQGMINVNTALNQPTIVPRIGFLNNQPSIIDFTITPNPTSDIINFSFDKTVTGIVEIYSIDGKLVFSKELNNNTLLSADLSGNNDGVYIAKITIGDQTVSKKIIKE